MWRDIGKARRWRQLRDPSVRLLWKHGATEAVLDCLESARVRCVVTLRRSPEEEAGEDSEGGEGGLPPPKNVLSFGPFLRPPPPASPLAKFLHGGTGKNEKGELH